jgi:hypothetical protein
MVLVNRGTQEIARALLRTRNEKYRDYSLGGYRESVIGGMGLPPALRSGVATSGDNVAIPTPRPHPFRDLAKLPDTGEAVDTARARDFSGYDQPAFFNVAPVTSPHLANSQITHERPSAAIAEASQQGNSNSLWESLFPSYCAPTDDTLSFPPLINQDKEQLTEADKAACHDQFEHDREQCYKNYNYHPDAWSGCYERAKIIRDLCLRGEREVLPWNDVDQDGLRFPKPRKRWKKK